jgi:hypothetical protein
MLSVSAHLDYIYVVACVWSNRVAAQVHLTVVSRRTNPRHRCVWDSWGLDVLTFNAFGIALGYWCA